jgi:hypothetical protein
MTEPILRPFSPNERQLLKQLKSGSEERTGDLLNGGLVFALVFVATQGLGWLLSLPRTQNARLGALIAIVIAVVIVAYMRRRHAGARGGLAYSRDLAGGMAEEATFDVVDAIRVEEFEDEGSQYFLKLADERVLFLAGQYLYEPEKARSFPCRKIRTTRAPNSRFLIDLACEGPYLEASGVRPPFSRREHDRSEVPQDGDVLRLNFDDLRRTET